MATAMNRDACTNGKFYFRKNIFSSTNNNNGNGPDLHESVDAEYDLFTINEIFNGKVCASFFFSFFFFFRLKNVLLKQAGTPFKGILPLMYSYLDSVNADFETRCCIGRYLDLISKRASGELVTAASWTRQFVRSHPAYKFDSVVSDEIAYDLLQRCNELAAGTTAAPELLGSFMKHAKK